MTPQFDTEQNALVFPARLLNRPVIGSDRELRRILERSIAEYWAGTEPKTTDQVIRMLRVRVIFGNASLEDVAADLGIQPRTLNRRLKVEGTSFRFLLNRTRLDVACDLLAGTKMAITNIALALGYADNSTFTHAFARWMGTAPSEWRLNFHQLLRRDLQSSL